MPDLLSDILKSDLLKCVDVGARGGLQQHWQRFAELIELDAFEPDAKACEEQKSQARPRENWYPIALAGHTGMATLYVVKKASSSSLYPPSPAIMDTYTHCGYGDLDHTIEVPVSHFSDFVKQYKRPLPNLIKLDTQGTELNILRSLEDEHWADLLAVQTEFEFAEAYIGQPLFHDVDAFMRSKGFLLFDMLVGRQYRVAEKREKYFLRKYLNISRNRRDISARALAGDAFYVRPPEEILKRGDRVLYAKMFLIFLIYRCLDEALWFAEAGRAHKLISDAETASLIDLVRSVAPKPNLWQRADKIGKWARRIRKKLGLGARRKIEYWMDRSWDY